ncbi:MAG: hypothetical protein KJN64_07855 [Ignavibacteria bacterium]|nr:hypothetical protein [Ignavibacteria bacterium]MBT8381033.1 hypothetical protein [Ignavibacteria bacterium]MBT8393036.1 hypothetical protein [Ignavibacteria bacterium]NNJ52017.1 hypothetical protein [Ignavibacteriaceae bacterium]NNL20499.1 hypothetical protein [Ignavibacteriaceae bacterium]
MRLLKLTTIVIASAIIFSGCIQIETKLFVKKDGSGTIKEKVLMSKSFVNMLKGFAQSFQDSTSEDEFTLFKDEEIKADAENYGTDVNYVSHDFIYEDNWEGYTAVYSFSDVSKIKLTPDPDDKVEVGMEEDTESAKDYYYFSIIKGDIAELTIDRPEIELNENELEDSEETNSEDVDNEIGEEFLEMMNGMSIKINVEVDGNISNTNASYVDGSEITLFQMNFSEMMKNKDDFKEFTNKQPGSLEEMKEFLQKFPSMKIEIEKPVKIKFN